MLFFLVLILNGKKGARRPRDGDGTQTAGHETREWLVAALPSRGRERRVEGREGFGILV